MNARDFLPLLWAALVQAAMALLFAAMAEAGDSDNSMLCLVTDTALCRIRLDAPGAGFDAAVMADTQVVTKK